MILATGYFPHRPQVQSRSINLEFMVDRMVVGLILFKHFSFPFQSKIVYKWNVLYYILLDVQ